MSPFYASGRSRSKSPGEHTATVNSSCGTVASHGDSQQTYVTACDSLESADSGGEQVALLRRQQDGAGEHVTEADENCRLLLRLEADDDDERDVTDSTCV